MIGGRAGTAVRLTVACLAVVTLVIAGQGAYQATRTGTHLLDSPTRSREQQQYELLRDDLATKIRSGSRIYIADASAIGAAGDQRMAEFATMNGIVVVGKGQPADYVVWVQPDQDGFYRVFHRRAG